MDLYEVLGIKRNATYVEIRNAYREKSKEYHPDMSSGSDEAFRRINLAYKVLSDDNKRVEYDENGIMDDTGSGHIQNIANAKFADLVDRWVSNMMNGDKIPLKKYIIGGLNNGENKITDASENIKFIIEDIIDLKKRVTHKEGKSIIHNIMDEKIKQHRKAIKHNEQELLVISRIREMLEDYDFEEGKEEELITTINSSATTSFGQGMYRQF